MHNILVCDDDRDIVAALKIYLSGGEYRVFEAYNGAEAVEAVRKNDIHLVLMDIMMPEMNGLELTAKVKSDIEYSHIPVILLTAKTTLEAKVEGFECGADVYIEKPFSIRQLRKQIENLLKLRQAFHKMMVAMGLPLSAR